MTIDTLLQVETPEGIDLQAELAGPVPRALAYAVDIGLRSLLIGLIWLLLIPFGRAGIGVILLLSFLLEWFYPVLFELWRDGQTPGKRLFGLAVVNDDLTPVRAGPSTVRNLLRAADFLPFAYLGGLIAMAASRRFQRLGDVAAGTLVIHRLPRRQAPTLPEAAPLPPPQALTLEEQLAVIEFTQRHRQLSGDRQRELAELTGDLTGARGQAAVERLRGIGLWLLGAR